MFFHHFLQPSHLFDLAGAEGWVNKDLPDYIILPKLEKKEQKPFSTEEQKALWDLYESGDDYAAIPLIMIYTGLMPGEMIKLTCEMVDLERQLITGVGSKTEVRRRSPVYLSASIVPVIKKIIEGREGKVWKMNKDKFYEIYYAVLERAGTRKLPPYSCRHTTATALTVENSVASQTVKEIMRWSSTRMLDRYTHPDSSDAIEAVNKL